MNLKDAFRYQNKLQSFLEEAQQILDCDENITKTESTYYRHRVIPEAEDEIIVNVPDTPYYDQITELVQFAVWLLDEKSRLSAAIRSSKNSLDIDMDSAVSLNAARQRLAKTLQRMNGLRNSEKTAANRGVRYRFNAEGNQVAYRCDVKQVTTIHYDRRIVHSLLSKLNRCADETSAALDLCLVNTKVDYLPPVDVNATFAEAFEQYCLMTAAAGAAASAD